MKPQFLALLTAMAWGVGGYFEKKGLQLGHLSPRLGIAVRTAVALVILGAVGFPAWKSIQHAGPRALLYLTIGGGVVAGSLGMLCWYASIMGAPLGRVMPIAFTSPMFGALMGFLFGGEAITMKTVLGMMMTAGGIALLTAR